MIAVIFEVWPTDDSRQTVSRYCRRPRDLSRIDGFLSIERFKAWLIPTNCFRSRSGATKMRCVNEQPAVSSGSTGKGRNGVFENYRLRVAGIMRDYGLDEQKAEAPDDSHAQFAQPHFSIKVAGLTPAFCRRSVP